MPNVLKWEPVPCTPLVLSICSNKFLLRLFTHRNSIKTTKELVLLSLVSTLWTLLYLPAWALTVDLGLRFGACMGINILLSRMLFILCFSDFYGFPCFKAIFQVGNAA
jgi:hypothetical protein